MTYIQTPIAFDIETTSYRDDGDKRAIVYTYTFSVDGEVTVLRTRDEFIRFVDGLIDRFEVTLKNRLVIYVHNLGFEFPHIRESFAWENVFAIGDTRKVARATTSSGIEFRCSYFLTNAPLARVGKEVGVPKMVGDLDYSLVRHHETALTDEELGYIANDVQIIIALIRDKLRRNKMGGIPLTKTGYTRRNVRSAVRKDKGYMKWVRDLKLTETDYVRARTAYQGGYVHANAVFAGRVSENVAGWDLASSYPSSLVQFPYPTSIFADIETDDRPVPEQVGDRAAMIDVTFTGLRCRYDFPAISESRCANISEPDIDNGRVFSASAVRVLITDVDYRTITRNYDIGSEYVHSISVASSGYLPTALTGAILDFYRDKTTLKGVAGCEDQYKAAKEDLNAIYGMMGTDPVRDEFVSDQRGFVEPVYVPLAQSIDDANKSRNRFLFYPWGAWVTAYSRWVLLSAIMDLQDADIDVLYCDTDSIYFVDHPDAAGIIESANEAIVARLRRALAVMGAEDRIPDLSPTDPSGRERHIGIFENDTEDGLIEEFKSLGAKRYAAVKDGEIHLTVSGLSKKASTYVQEHGGMDFFRDGMTIPAEHSGRLVHTYIDREIANILTDYNGVHAEVRQTGFVHLEPAEYHLSVSDTYIEFIQKTGFTTRES